LPREPERGFTLLELMIVLAVLSLGAALALPWLGRQGQAASLAGAAQQLRVALAAARSAAIVEDREIVFSGDGASYRVDGVPYALPETPASPVEIGPQARISFFPSGGSSGGRLVLRDAAAQREIEVETLTGRAVLLR
jgi:general secretion pathway protein H